VWRMVNIAEYKRRQAPPGVKITRRSFGRDRRYPIVNAFAGALALAPGKDGTP
jgi:NAD+ synthase